MNPDFLVIGAGIAGLRAAIELASAGQVLVIAKDRLEESSSEYAQGGIAAAIGEDDSVAIHEQDTLIAGDGLCNQAAVRALVEEGPPAIEQLIEWGAEFDRDGGRVALTREGAHSRNRILHAHGDSTGREIARALYAKASSIPNIAFHSFSATVDLLLRNGQVTGALVFDAKSRSLTPIDAKAVLLATGGLGCAYRDTTNPEIATGDGVAIAYRAGAEISDIEFVQFHPTALRIEGAPRFLLSEALRGEGAYLRNAAGERFMGRYHPLGELAPRDVVSRSIVAEMEQSGEWHVFLDLTHLDADFVRRRFPRIYETCLKYGLDLTASMAPVHPAAHYAMGGVFTGLDGRTSLPGLFAAGEVAATGVHGANRLASNSLLEALVFGARAGTTMRAVTGGAARPSPAVEPVLFPQVAQDELRRLATEKCGIRRSAAGLASAIDLLGSCGHASNPAASVVQFEIRNVFTVVDLIARCALARAESRGGHFRTDFPSKRPEFQKHSVISRNHDVIFR